MKMHADNRKRTLRAERHWPMTSTKPWSRRQMLADGGKTRKDS